MSFKVLNSNQIIHGAAVRFEWHGGPYVEVYFNGAEYPYECINVWSQTEEAPAYPFTRKSLNRIVSEWRSEHGRDEINAYIKNNGY